MNNVIQEYLALVERTVYYDDLDAFDAIEELEEQYARFKRWVESFARWVWTLTFASGRT